MDSEELYYLITRGNSIKLEALLKTGFDVNTPLPSGDTMLVTSACMGDSRLDITRLLVRYGASVTTKVKGLPLNDWIKQPAYCDNENTIRFLDSEAAKPAVQGKTEFKSSVRDFGHFAGEYEGDTIDEARKKAASEIPPGHKILFEKILADSDIKVLRMSGMDEEECYYSAIVTLPVGSIITDMMTIQQPGKTKTTAIAQSPEEAEKIILGKTQNARLLTISEIGKEKDKLFGMVKGKTIYEAEIEQAAIVDFSYHFPKARIYVRSGSKIYVPSPMLKYDDLPEILWAFSQHGIENNGLRISIELYFFSVILQHQQQARSQPSYVMNNFNAIADDLFFNGMAFFTRQCLLKGITYSEYEPVIDLIIRFFKSTLQKTIRNISAGNNETGLIRICNSLRIEENFDYHPDKIKIIKNSILGSFLCFEEFLKFREIRSTNFDEDLARSNQYDSQ